jgi:hypothetical protein
MIVSAGRVVIGIVAALLNDTLLNYKVIDES